MANPCVQAQIVLMRDPVELESMWLDKVAIRRGEQIAIIDGLYIEL